MKIKRGLLICVLLSILLIMVILSIKLYTESSHALIDKGDYDIKYIISVGHKEYRLETYIDTEGNALRTHTNLFSGEKTTENGYYPVSKVKGFLKYAVEKNIFNMNDQMFAKGVHDGANIYFEIRIGDNFVRAGGYAPMEASKDFMKILTRFRELEQLGNYE